MAQIIQFPQRQSNAFSNLSQLIDITEDSLALQEYASVMAVCAEENYFFPGEVEKLTEQVRKKRLELAAPKEKPARPVDGPGLYCYTPEMGEQKPSCQIEAQRSYYGKHFHIQTPLDLKGKGIILDGVIDESRLTDQYKYKAGWFEYTVTTRAYEKLQEKYSISQEVLLD